MESITSSKEERTWALAAHISAFCGHFFPLGNIVGPLIVWLIKKDEMPLVKDQAKWRARLQGRWERFGKRAQNVMERLSTLTSQLSTFRAAGRASARRT